MRLSVSKTWWPPRPPLSPALRAKCEPAERAKLVAKNAAFIPFYVSGVDGWTGKEGPRERETAGGRAMKKAAVTDRLINSN